MAIEATFYLTYPEAVEIHIRLMRRWNEVRYGVDNKDLIASALARPQQAAFYENADLPRQAATLCYGLVKNHPWVGGNKRTATVLMQTFLVKNGWQVNAARNEWLEMVLRVEADRWKVAEIKVWLRQHTIKIEENR